MGNIDDATDECHCMENRIDSPMVIGTVVCQCQSLSKQDILIICDSWQFECLHERFIGVYEGQVFVLGHLENVVLKINVVRSEIYFGHQELLILAVNPKIESTELGVVIPDWQVLCIQKVSIVVKHIDFWVD